MKLAIVGSRTATNINLSEYISVMPDVIVSGGAKGVDTIAEQFALSNGIDTLIFKPDYARYGRCAPIKRNEDIIKNADKVLAFWDGKSKGTLSSINYAKKYGKELKIIRI